jgi:C-terminal processing protease CtpA/Prc
MKRLLLFSFGLFVSLGFFTQCSDDPTGVGSEYLEVNSWIRNQMSNYYYWNFVVPRMAPGNLAPEQFFEEILYTTDEFSYMTDDAETLLNELSGSQYSSGFSPAILSFSDQDQLFMVVKYVYPGSPAQLAGLQRGDIILSVNGQTLNSANYQELLQINGTVSYGLGSYSLDEVTQQVNITDLDSVISVQKDILQLDPVITTKVIETGGKRIGYLFYAQFIDGTADLFINGLNEQLAELKAQQIDELVIDLRYNPGGRITAASQFANALVPLESAQNKDIFVEFEYNSLLENFYQNTDGVDSENLFLRFQEGPVSMGLERIYVLTTNQTASASELLIHGLKPYMEVITVGSNTLGKYYGSFVITGTFQSPPVYYAILPVTLKYLNADQESDFIDGLEAQIGASENILSPKPLGDPTDPLLEAAISDILGEPVSAKPLPTTFSPTVTWYPTLSNQLQSKAWFIQD